MVRDGLVHADRAKLGNSVVSISLPRPDLSRFLRRVSAPTLFITGTDHQGWTPVQAEAFSELLPDGSVAVVPTRPSSRNSRHQRRLRDASVGSG